MKNLFKIALLLFTFAALSFISAEKETISVVIDAGHGGHDFGADHHEYLEKDLVNSISKKINELNSDKNIKIHFTREDDSFHGLQKRVDFINSIKPDLVISLHVNKNKNLSTNGFEVFVSDNSITYEKSNELAQKLISGFGKNSPLKNRGIKTAPLYLLKKSEAPALLLEMGYISNKKDREYITDENCQTEIAKTILTFVSNLK